MSNVDCDRVLDTPTSEDPWTSPFISVKNPLNDCVPTRKMNRDEQLHELSLMLYQPDKSDFEGKSGRRATTSDQRQFSRCQLEDDQSLATLRINGNKFDCRLVELSIGGFGIELKQSSQFKLGAVGSFHARGLNYIVSINRLESRPGSLYIGLKQVEEVLDHRYLSGNPSPVVGNLLAGVAGTLIAAVAFCFMYGTR